jgi:D-lactate dehydrogenase
MKTVKLAEGFEGISIFTTDKSDTVLEKLYLCGVRYIALRSVGSDNVDIKKELWESKWQRTRVLPLLCSRACSYLTIGIKSKDYSRSKLMQMGDYRLDHLVGFDLHGKK